MWSPPKSTVWMQARPDIMQWGRDQTLRAHAAASLYGKFKIRWWRQGRGGGARGLLGPHVLRLDLGAGRQHK